MRKGFWRLGAASLSAAALSLTIAAPSFAGASAYERIAGADRIETSLQIMRAFETAGNKWSDTAVLARSDNFPDALSAASLSGALRSPLLLTGKDTLNENVAKALKTKGFKKIILIGGYQALSTTVEEQVRTLLGSTEAVRRVAGADRYQTSLLLAKETLNLTGAKDVLFVNGENFADAVVAGPAAVRTRGSIVLLSTKGANKEQYEFIQNKGYRLHAIGHPALSAARALNLKMNTEIAGSDRYQTSVAVAEKFFAQSRGMFMASGVNFPDALTSGVLAGLKEMPLILTETNKLSPYVNKWLTNKSNTITSFNVTFIGGNEAISPNVVASVKSTIVNTSKSTNVNTSNRNNNNSHISIDTKNVIKWELPNAPIKLEVKGQDSGEAYQSVNVGPKLSMEKTQLKPDEYKLDVVEYTYRNDSNKTVTKKPKDNGCFKVEIEDNQPKIGIRNNCVAPNDFSLDEVYTLSLKFSATKNGENKPFSVKEFAVKITPFSNDHADGTPFLCTIKYDKTTYEPVDLAPGGNNSYNQNEQKELYKEGKVLCNFINVNNPPRNFANRFEVTTPDGKVLSTKGMAPGTSGNWTELTRDSNGSGWDLQLKVMQPSNEGAVSPVGLKFKPIKNNSHNPPIAAVTDGWKIKYYSGKKLLGDCELKFEFRTVD